MSYAERETSVHDAAPIELYEFLAPGGKAYRYHDADESEPIIFNGAVYTALEIERGATVIGSDAFAQTTDVKVPYRCAIAVDGAYLENIGNTTLTVYRAHRGELGDYRTVWTGQVLHFATDDLVTTIQCQQGVKRVGAEGLQGTFIKTTCNHILYGVRCGVSKAAHTTTARVTSIGTSAVTVDDDGVDNELLKAGEVVNTRTGETRMAINNVDNVITLNMAFTDIEVGDTLNLSKGCILTPRVCQTVFNNGRRFGGFSFVPKQLLTAS